ncbi:hypothetical protein WA026_002026 [Henosepilachna vigintioctopunctata]|uniref:Uncharacterized protein n=1 Tax=Henosepilachna vigintioctopunctata TaxID=420089 RepID=A0AAW1UW74_9CUCU
MDQFITDYNYIPSEGSEVEPEKLGICFGMGSFAGLTVLHMNIRSLAEYFDELKVFLAVFDFCSDCIVLSDIFQLSDPPRFNLDGYDMLYNEGNYNRNDGMVIKVI